MRRFTLFKGGNNNPSTTNTEQSKRTKKPTSSERKDNCQNSTPIATLSTKQISQDTNVKKVVSNRKQLFLSHVKQKKIKLDKREQSYQEKQNITSACGQEVVNNKRATNSMESLELWTSFHSKQGLHSCFYIEPNDTEETHRYGQIEMKEPPRIIPRKTCV